MTTAPRSVDDSSLAAAATGPRAVPADRRNRPHLRDLCDEVLASFRAAHERDVVSDRDRQDAQPLLARFTPSLQR